MPARVALVCEFPTLSGGEAAAVELLLRLDRTRYEPVVLAPPGGALERRLHDAGIPLRRLDLREGGVKLAPPAAAEAVARAAAAAGADLLHANSLAMARATGPAGESAGIPTLAHCRDVRSLSRAESSAIAKNRRLIAVSMAVEEHLVAEGVPRERFVLVPDGVDAERAAAGVPGRFRASLGVPAGARLIGCVGQLALRKGQDVFVEAAAAVLAACPDAFFVLVGSRFSEKAESREYEAALHRRVGELRLDGRVLFAGQRSDIADVLADLDVLAHPANEEPQSMAILEAMAAGRPVVATAVGGTPELIREGGSGLLVPPKDPPALARALARVLGDGELARRLATGGRARVQADFRPEVAADRIAGLYAALLEKRCTERR
ncbi:MAG: glycosyltransferase family 4 protein [Planctomycetes bacterium]|nr:glycosyltransferase family 4 protein [Planctomycetota bacterium]